MSHCRPDSVSPATAGAASGSGSPPPVGPAPLSVPSTCAASPAVAAAPSTFESFAALLANDGSDDLSPFVCPPLWMSLSVAFQGAAQYVKLPLASIASVSWVGARFIEQLPSGSRASLPLPFTVEWNVPLADANFPVPPATTPVCTTV